MTTTVSPISILKKSKNWASFKQQLDLLGSKEKGDSFELLTKYFLQLDPRYATILKNVWSLTAGEVPLGIHAKLNLPEPDEGIDLVAETHEGRFWSIQCKYVADEGNSIGRQKLGTFTDLSFTICKEISMALICTPLDRFSYKLEKYYGNRISYCAGENYRDLDEEFFAQVHTLLAGKQKPLKPFEPRDHQLRAIINGIEHFGDLDESRGKMIMPCGTGKSLAAYWIARELASKMILIAVPNLSLIRQTLEVWARESIANGEKIRWICVCSDKSVKEVSKDEDSVLAQDLGVEINTDPKEIALWLSKPSEAINVVFVTYQSGHCLSEASAISNTIFDFGIFDEAHRTVGLKSKLFGHMLSDENIGIRKRLFMTATEKHFRGDSDEILTMDDSDIYGETFALLSFKEALACEPPILTDYQVVTIAVTTDEIKELIQANVFVQPIKDKTDKEIEAKMLATALQLRKTMQRHPLDHCISFHSSIARAKAFSETQENINQQFKKFDNLECFHVNGAMPTSVRKRSIDAAIMAKRSLITNARCLSEGLDVNEIDGVLFADPKGSSIDIVQAVGRALRPHKDKKRSYVVVPVVLDSDKIRERIEQNEAYEDLLMTLRALASSDDRIVEYFRSVSQGKQTSTEEAGFAFEVSTGLEVDPVDFAEKVTLRIWDKLAKLSWMPFEEAREFVQSLNLKDQAEWYQYIKNGKEGFIPLPADIPRTPSAVYENKGWTSWGDWLGTGRIANQKRNYRSFEEAREFARSLKLRNMDEWTDYCKQGKEGLPPLPDDIPVAIYNIYRDKGWKGMGDWLGTGTIASWKRNYRSFEEARKFARSLKLKGDAEWKDYCKNGKEGLPPLPDDIPAAIYNVYRDKGWKGMGDWLGTGAIAPSLRNYRSFEEAREFARSLQLGGANEWYAYAKNGKVGLPPLPNDIPSSVHHVYADEGWTNWGDWLGTKVIATYLKSHRPFNEAREFARSLKLKSGAEWNDYCKNGKEGLPPLPDDIPVTLYNTYKDKGWKSMGDWLGTGTIAAQLRTYRPFNEAREFARSLKLKSAAEWKDYCKHGKEGLPPFPDDIPVNVHSIYSDKGWKGMGDWLGTGAIASQKRKFRSFEEAREFARSLKLKSLAEWNDYCKHGKEGLPSLPGDIPVYPGRPYKDKGWKGVGDWLGTGAIAPSLKNYRSLEEAREFARSLKLKSGAEWKDYCKHGKEGLPPFPDDIPANPHQAYKDKGWKGIGDWLGY